MRPFEGNGKADVAPGENEFDTPAGLDISSINSNKTLLILIIWNLCRWG